MKAAFTQTTSPAELIAQLHVLARADYPSTYDTTQIFTAFASRYSADFSAARELRDFLNELAETAPDRAALFGRVGAQYAKRYAMEAWPGLPSPMQRACVDGLLTGLERRAMDHRNIDGCLDDLGNSLFFAAGIPELKLRIAELAPRIAAPLALLNADDYEESMEIFRQRLDTTLMGEEEQQQTVLKNLAARNTELRGAFANARARQEAAQVELLEKELTKCDPRPEPIRPS